MKFSADQASLLKSINNLQSIVEKRNTIPILGNIKLEVEGSQITFTATDLDIVATDIVPANVEEGGIITIPAQKFYDIIRKLNGAAIVNFTLEQGSDQMIINSGEANFRLSYLPADDFPIMAKGEVESNFTISATDMFRLLNYTGFAMSREETRYYLNGIYLHEVEGALRAVATDGHRLARIDVPLPEGANGMTGVIIPRKAVTELKKMLESQTGDVNIEVTENKIFVSFGNVTFLSKLVDGTFPDYARAIPTGNGKRVVVGRDHLVEAVDRVSTISTDKTKSIKFSFAGGTLVLSARSNEADSAKEQFEIDYDGSDFDIGFNANYALEMLRQFNGDSVHMELEDANSPALIKDSANDNSLYVLMPMRI